MAKEPKNPFHPGEILFEQFSRAGGYEPGRFRRRDRLDQDSCQRDGADADAHGSRRIEDTAIGMIDLDAVRASGIEAAAARAVRRLTSPMLEGFWIHLDADVLDDTIMPAVDYRMSGGLTWDELAIALGTSIGSRRAVGIDVTIFNPRLDGNGSIARAFVVALANRLNA